MKQILIVDDEEFNRDLIRKILRKEGFETKEAVNGKEALDLLDAFTFDLVLMDLMMPVMDGFEAMTTIRENGSYTGLPVVAFTALSDESTKKRAIGAGADVCLTKPINLNTFLHTLKTILDKS